MRWAALYRCPPIFRGVSASKIRADHPANQAWIGSAVNGVPVAPVCRREFREPCKQFGLTSGQEQENIHERRQGTDAKTPRLLVKRTEEGGGDVRRRWRL